MSEIPEVLSKKHKQKVSSPALHPEFTLPLVDVAELSMEKGYTPLNWLQLGHQVTITQLLDAAQRHLNKVRLGIDINREEKTLDGNPTKTQCLHAAQVAYNMLMICMQQLKGYQIDDRMFKDGESK